MARHHAIFFFAACSLLGGVAVACGTSNGEAGTAGVDDPPAEDPTSEPSKPSRPAFEAGFPEPDAGDGGAVTNPDPGMPCNDPGDPGSTSGTARSLPETDDCDETVKNVSGVISSGTDIDLYKLSTVDKTGCLTNNLFSLATAGVEMCVFLRCKNEDVGTTTAVTGCGAGTKKTDPTSTWEGCCAVGPADPTPVYDCPGVIANDDSADYLIRVAPTASTKACQAYSFGYRF
jgi:hypothetical protein